MVNKIVIEFCLKTSKSGNFSKMWRPGSTPLELPFTGTGTDKMMTQIPWMLFIKSFLTNSSSTQKLAQVKLLLSIGISILKTIFGTFFSMRRHNLDWINWIEPFRLAVTPSNKEAFYFQVAVQERDFHSLVHGKGVRSTCTISLKT